MTKEGEPCLPPIKSCYPVKLSAETVNTLKNLLDNFWFDQEVLYDYKADLRGI